MPSSRGFLTLGNRYIIDASLVPNHSAIHVGSGAVSEKTDMPFITDSTGCFIPGSSIRGVMRSTLERMLQAIGGGRGCVLFADDSHPTCFTATGNGRLKAFEARLAALPPAERDERLNRKVFSDGLCDICKLFGSPLLASKLRVSDARPAGNVKRLIRDGVGIDRDTESAREKIKFDFETVEASQWNFQMQIENASETDFALLAILIAEMEHGIDVGGNKARGLGRCTLTLNYPVKHFDGAEDLRRFLTTGNLQDSSKEQFKARLARCLQAYLKPQTTKEEGHAAAGGK